jgi:alkanesulfonate monooxygenase SsuD/methylene tetrahydromethanopterin reductase-like flavin-dependent oxidoreductase (luciferase family)
MQRNLRFGVMIPTFGGKGGHHTEAPNCDKPEADQITHYAKLCEKLGYDAIHVSDHFMFGKDDQTLESWVTLSTLASLSSRIKIGSWMFCNSYRNPAITAKMGSTLDIFSKGRLILGYGAGWYRKEYDAYGIPYEAGRVRIEQMVEGLEIITRLWTLDEVDFDGKYYRLCKARCAPKPVQKPHPPIMIGADKPLSIRAAAKFADIWEMSGGVEYGRLQMNLQLFKKCCVELERDQHLISLSWAGHALARNSVGEVDEFLKQIDPARKWDLTTQTPPYLNGSIRYTMVGSVNECVERIRTIRSLGFDSFTLTFLDFPETQSLEIFAEEVIPNFR